MIYDNPYWFICEKGIEADYLYFIRFNKWLKIGTTCNLIQRYNAIRFSLPEECELIGYFKTKMFLALENRFIEDLRNSGDGVRGEWVVWNEESFNQLVFFWSKEHNIEYFKNG